MTDSHFKHTSRQQAIQEKIRTNITRKKRRSFFITLIDLAFIGMVAVFFAPKILNKKPILSHQGYEFSLDNQFFSGKTLIEFRSSATPEAQMAAQPYSVSFYEDSEETVSFSVKNDYLPAVHEQSFIELAVPALQGKKIVAVIRFADGQTINLTQNIRHND